MVNPVSPAGPARPAIALPPNFPKIITLCGSTRFYVEFMQANYEQTSLGKIVLSVGFFPRHAADLGYGSTMVTHEQKKLLDKVYMDKIDLSDEVLVLNKDGYIGKSARRELWYALMRGKVVTFLEPDTAPTARQVHDWFADWDVWTAAASDAAVI